MHIIVLIEEARRRADQLNTLGTDNILGLYDGLGGYNII